MIVKRLHDWYRINRYNPMRRALLESDPEWVALDAAESGRVGNRAERTSDEWRAVRQRMGEIEHRLLPVDPWPERAWTRWEQHLQLAGLYHARARRRDDVCGIPRDLLGEHIWEAGATLAARVAGIVALTRRVVADRGYDRMSWPEWQEILTDNDDPPTKCLRYAAGEVPEGCSPDCSQPNRGRVTCLKPRSDALARIAENSKHEADDSTDHEDDSR